MIKNQDFGADEIYEWRLKGWYWRGRWKKENLISDASPRCLPAATAAETFQQESNHWKVTLLPFSDIVTFLVTFYWHQAPSLVVCLNIFFFRFFPSRPETSLWHTPARESPTFSRFESFWKWAFFCISWKYNRFPDYQCRHWGKILIKDKIAESLIHQGWSGVHQDNHQIWRTIHAQGGITRKIKQIVVYDILWEKNTKKTF